ncbi:tRNA lysidine(34) synthetase TilS [Castellaniella sp. MT123]|uniref:tRNA lysidine(34) synthetase TilS n=1 Tax=Castellaniella sp. MT123 TaxID=3140381 RepID=UPI0031F3A4E5
MKPVAADRWCATYDDDLLTAVRVALADVPAGAALGVALSAGADSAMLALHAARVAADTGRHLHCFHIHHGLQASADEWLNQAHRLAGLIGVSCHSRRVRVDAQGTGMEAAARAARYAALADLAAQAGVGHVLLAHHQDDQAETVLLRLLRGAGPLGLGAMAPVMRRDDLLYLRPWLDQPRSHILQAADRFAAISGWQPVHDPSNRDARYARGAVRADLAPVLDGRWPAWRRTLARHARQARELEQWALDAVREDWPRLDPDADGLGFSLASWRLLPASRQAPVLRFWLRSQGLRMPTEARLDAWLKQLREVHALGHDRQVRLRHESHWIVVQKGRVLLVPETSSKPS